MKIGFDAKRATQNFRGLGNYSRGIIDGLMEFSNHDLFLYTPQFKDQRAIDWVKEHEGSRFKVVKPEGKLFNTLPSLWRSRGVSSNILNDKLDIYHGLSHEIPYGLKGKPVNTVVTVHDLIFMRYPEFFPLIDRLSYKRKFTYAVKNADLVIAICEQTKRDIIELLGGDHKKIIVHYQSADPHFYHQRPFEMIKNLMKKYGFARPFMLMVGAVEERKNQLGLIEAYSQIANQVEQDLVIIGQGKDYLQSCKKLVEAKKLQRRVHFLSGISFEELPLFYQAADLFCFPSFFEGMGIPIMEALFSKTPVLTSLGSCFPESAGPGSVFIDPKSPNEIAKGIVGILGSVEKQEEMIKTGFEFAQQFHIKNTTKKLLDIYNGFN